MTSERIRHRNGIESPGLFDKDKLEVRRHDLLLDHSRQVAGRYSDATNLLTKTCFEGVGRSQGDLGVNAAAEDEDVRIGAKNNIDKFKDGVLFQTGVECADVTQG